MALSGQATPSEAGPSKSSLIPGPSAYHESSQFRHWRFSPSTLNRIRSELNTKSVEVARRNTELEKVNVQLCPITGHVLQKTYS